MVTELPTSSTGFSRASAIYGEIAGDVAVAATLATTYDSNVTRGSGTSDRPKESDLITSVGMNLGYQKSGELWRFVANATGSYDEYLDLDDYDGLNYRLSASGGYSGGRVVASLVSSLSRERGQNRFANSFVQQTTISNRLTTRLRVSPKTALVGMINQTTAVADNKDFNDSTSLDFSLAALWSSSPLLDIGPGVRYGIRTGSGSSDSTVFGPNININYQLSTKVSVRSTVGLSQVDNGSGSDSTSSNWSIRAVYEASQLWSMDLALFKDTQSNTGFQGGLDEVTTYRLGYTRKIRRATFDMSAGYEIRTSQSDNANGAVSRDYDYMTLDSSISMPIYKTAADLTFSVRYQNLMSDADFNSYDGIQTGLALSWRF